MVSEEIIEENIHACIIRAIQPVFKYAQESIKSGSLLFVEYVSRMIRLLEESVSCVIMHKGPYVPSTT